MASKTGLTKAALWPEELPKIDQLLNSSPQKKLKNLGVIVPDPAQIPASEYLLIAQKDSIEEAKQFVPCDAEENLAEAKMQHGIKK
jgi:hypothetical protein